MDGWWRVVRKARRPAAVVLNNRLRLIATRISSALPLPAMSSQHPLPQIGAHCSLSSCSLNDFLPIRCTCQQLFCRDHISPDIHHCPLLRAAPPTASSSPQLLRCAAQSCNKPSLESWIAQPSDTTNRSPALCSGCKRAFCAEYLCSISIPSRVL